MKYNALLLLAVFATPSFADITLHVPDNIELLVANEAKPKKSGHVFSSVKTLTLPNGENQIVFRYTPYFDQGKDRVIVNSDAIVATFTAADTELHFNMPKYRDESTAEKNMASLDWSLLDGKGIEIAVKEDKLLKDGMQIGRDFRREVQDYNQSGGVAAWGYVPSITLPAQGLDTVKEGSTTAEEMLHFWYQKADPQTRDRFKDFVNQ